MDIATLSTLETLLARVQKNRAAPRITGALHAAKVSAKAIAPVTATPAKPVEPTAPEPTQLNVGARDIRDPGATLHGLPVMFTPTSNAIMRNATTSATTPAMQQVTATAILERRALEVTEKALNVPVHHSSPQIPAVADVAAVAAAALETRAIEKRPIVSETPTLTGAPTFASEAAPSARRTFGSMLENSLSLRLRK